MKNKKIKKASKSHTSRTPRRANLVSPFVREVELFSEVKSLRVNEKELFSLVAVLDAHHTPKNHGTLSIAFLTHDHLAWLHAEHCDDASPTDIITFPALAANGSKDKNDNDQEKDGKDFGQLCISPTAARLWIKENGGTFENELRRYVIHGYLHLVGYDDTTPAKQKKMRAEEEKALKQSAKIKKIFSWKA